MKAILLSAGQGSRLAPLTADRPKCLLSVGSRTLIDWQLEALKACGIAEVAVVIGFQAEMMETHLARHDTPGFRVRTVFNPFYKVADNLGSCWMARAEMAGDFLIVNGDTLFEPDIARKVLASPAAPITITIDRKPAYDEDDMKIVEEDGTLKAVGKKLSLETVNGESIGMLLFRGTGPRLFVDTVEAMMRTPDGAKVWYLQAIDRLARTGAVRTCLIHGLRWGEVDFLPDLDRARAMVAAWERP
jgi:choline kinase